MRTAPRRLPAPRTALLGNLGSYHRAIKTANADAQKFFDEGPDAALRLQSRRVVQVVRDRGGEGCRVADAALGHVARARHQHQRHRAGRSIEAGLHASRGSREAQGRRQRRGAGTHRCAREALRRRSDGRSSRARAGVLGCDGRAVEEVPGRSRRRDALRREPDEPAAVAPLHEGRHAGARHRQDRRGARRRDEARSESPGRESLLHPRRRGVEVARSRARRRRGGSRRWCPAPDISSTCPRTSTFAPASTRSRRRATPMRPRVDEKYFKATGAQGPLSDDVLHAQRAVRIGRGDVCRQPRAGARGGASAP